jgi:hypothetical protein
MIGGGLCDTSCKVLVLVALKKIEIETKLILSGTL